jgi:YegS/Rv2252/BmrU family lipid kinase
LLQARGLCWRKSIAQLVHVIVNPTAGGGRTSGLLPDLADSIRHRFGEDVHIHVTAGPGDAIGNARTVIRQGASLVLVVGGDGTIQEVVNGFFENGLPLNPACELGVLSCGTGRGFANSVGLPDSLEAQLDGIVNGSPVSLDVGRVRYMYEDGKPAERLFVNECQAGIGGAVVRAVGMGWKRLGGTLAFGLTAVSELVRLECSALGVRLDDGEEITGRFIGVFAGNGALCGGGMRLTPAARPDDGVLDVVLVRSMNVPVRLWVFPRIYRGEHTRLRRVSSHRCRRLRVSLAAEPEGPKPWVEADGELLGFPPYEVDLLPGALRVRGARLPARKSAGAGK